MYKRQILCVIARRLLSLLYGVVFLARFSIKRKVMAYPPHGSAQKERIRFALYCVAVLLRRFLYQRAEGCSAIWNGKGERSVPISHRLFSPKSEDSPHQSCLQPFPNILVNAIIDIAALVVEPVSYTHLDVYKRQPRITPTL